MAFLLGKRHIWSDRLNDELTLPAQLNDIIFQVLYESIDDSLNFTEYKSILLDFGVGKILVKAKYYSLLSVSFHVFGDVFDALAFARNDIND